MYDVGPVPHSIIDFWRMVWEQKAATIVMLTGLEEKGRVCCTAWFFVSYFSTVLYSLEISTYTFSKSTYTFNWKHFSFYSIPKKGLHQSLHFL